MSNPDDLYRVIYQDADGDEQMTGAMPLEAARTRARVLENMGCAVGSVMGDVAARGYMHARYAPKYRGVDIPLDLRADGVPRSVFDEWKRGVDSMLDSLAPAPMSGPRNVYLDTEFLRWDLSPGGLVSIALTDDQGRDYYAVNADMDYGPVMANDWMRANVWPFLPKTATHALDREHKDCRNLRQIRTDLTAYFQLTDGPVHLYAYYGAQDVVRLHGLWGGDWDEMPGAIPRWFFDLKALAVQAGNPKLPEQASGAHHPLEDARHNRTVHRFLVGGAS